MQAYFSNTKDKHIEKAGTFLLLSNRILDLLLRLTKHILQRERPPQRARPPAPPQQQLPGFPAVEIDQPTDRIAAGDSICSARSRRKSTGSSHLHRSPHGGE